MIARGSLRRTVRRFAPSNFGIAVIGVVLGTIAFCILAPRLVP